MGGPQWPCAYLAPLRKYGRLKFFQKGSSRNRSRSSVVGRSLILHCFHILLFTYRARSKKSMLLWTSNTETGKTQLYVNGRTKAVRERMTYGEFVALSSRPSKSNHQLGGDSALQQWLVDGVGAEQVPVLSSHVFGRVVHHLLDRRLDLFEVDATSTFRQTGSRWAVHLTDTMHRVCTHTQYNSPAVAMDGRPYCPAHARRLRSCTQRLSM